MKEEQQHPQASGDRNIVDRLLQENSTPYNLAELARLRIRFGNFPGAWDIKRDLDVVMEKWSLTEEELFENTRQLHSTNSAYRQGIRLEDQQDWS